MGTRGRMCTSPMVRVHLYGLGTMYSTGCKYWVHHIILCTHNCVALNLATEYNSADIVCNSSETHWYAEILLGTLDFELYKVCTILSNKHSLDRTFEF